MKTPIVDFVKEYQKKSSARFHMPGHKGHVFFGWEPYDITEIPGADVLHMGNGIIAESEKNAGLLFGSGATHFSTEGSSHCIKAMLAVLRMESGNPFLLSGRNVHRSMIDACALLDLDLQFIDTEEKSHLCTVRITPAEVEKALLRADPLPAAVYLTSPDYLGEISDIRGIADVCGQYQVPLIVDNAHGAYLHFLERQHPLDLGAAMCCDSAHKTLPVLTGGAYLHIHPDYLGRFGEYAAQALCLFGSTSPSYLVLQSLDLTNRYLSEQYEERLRRCAERVKEIKKRFLERGIPVRSSEPLKIVIEAGRCGYTGEETAEELRAYQVECEYADQEFAVLMVTPENSEEDYLKLERWAEHTELLKNRKKERKPFLFSVLHAQRVMSIREASLARSEWIPVKKALGRICAAETVSCPPAVPIAICGEKISEEMIQAFLSYGILKVRVVTDL